jgi:curli biogenesis system outer membrane secretion channel CsgG
MGHGEYKGLKHAIGVKDFENNAGWRGQWDLGNSLTAMLESALFDTGRFVLVEREQLRDVIQEQDLSASGRTAKAKDVAKTGLLRPARYLATGDVTEVEDAEAGGGGGIGFGGFKVKLGGSKSRVTIIAKLIDTTTGEIVNKKRIVGAPGGLKAGISYSGGVDWDAGGFGKTPLGKAAQDAINHAAKFFAEAMQDMPFEGNVVKVASSGQVIINRGSVHGIETDLVLVMAEEGELLIDPSTGEVLDREEGEVIGMLRVVKVREKVAYCEVVEGEAAPEPGTTVQKK